MIVFVLVKPCCVVTVSFCTGFHDEISLKAASMLFPCKPKTTPMNIVEEVIEEGSTYVEYQERVYFIPCGKPLKVTRTNLSVN